MGAAGVQLVKLTPYRSYISIFFTLQCICFMSILGLKGGVLTYSAVSTLSQHSMCHYLVWHYKVLLPLEPRTERGKGCGTVLPSAWTCMPERGKGCGMTVCTACKDLTCITQNFAHLAIMTVTSSPNDMQYREMHRPLLYCTALHCSCSFAG